MKKLRFFWACLLVGLLAGCGPSDDQAIAAWRLRVEASIAALDENMSVLDRQRIDTEITYVPKADFGGVRLRKQQLELKCLALNRVDTIRDPKFDPEGAPRPNYYEEQDGVLTNAGVRIVGKDGRYLDAARQGRFEKAQAEFRAKDLHHSQQTRLLRFSDEWTAAISRDIRWAVRSADRAGLGELLAVVKSTLRNQAAVEKIVAETGGDGAPK